MTLRVNNNDYELSTSLRVVYALKEIAGASSMQAAIGAISTLDLDGQLALLYAAYKAANRKNADCLDSETFKDLLLDNLGIFAISNAINTLTDGLLYSGLSQEEIASKKTAVEAKVATATATGMHSSAADIN